MEGRRPSVGIPGEDGLSASLQAVIMESIYQNVFALHGISTET